MRIISYFTLFLLLPALAISSEKNTVQWHIEQLLLGKKPYSFVRFEDYKTKKFVQLIRDPDGTIRGDLPQGAIRGNEKRAASLLKEYGVYSFTEIKTGDGQIINSYVIPFKKDIKAATDFVYRVFKEIYKIKHLKLIEYES